MRLEMAAYVSQKGLADERDFGRLWSRGIGFAR